MKEKPNLILLSSGGWDSRVLLEIACKMQFNPLCLLFDYGQKHLKELEFAKKTCKDKKVPFQQVQISLPKVHSKLTGNLQTTYEGVSPWYVPSRNLIFLSHAVSLAETMGVSIIWYGADFDDRLNLFPDCYQEWVVKLNKLLEINASTRITVYAPLLGVTKEVVRVMGKMFGIKEKEVFSGYGE